MPRGPLGLGLVLALGGLLTGLFSLGLGRLLAPEPVASGGWVTECSQLPAAGSEPALGVVRLSSPAPNGATLDLQYLNSDGTLLRRQHTRLLAGAVMSFSVPARDLGSTLRVVASDEVDVQVTDVFRRDDGSAELRPVSCHCQI
jgi:hypothetical protein